ncbi:hypothetical protein FM114_01480 [Luteococcus japonicus LSP_Lj1]|uniref:Uncharacterized protein n=2 Tax=Luteococcus japonicus TaxID=33984 RepID=A0A1R4IFN7_9ACTN|nr:hypothetical protein FM114_01480 [Luteococcus japonicus LSP_Lj1]
MLALDRQIAMEDAEDARREHRRLKAGLPEAPRVITVFEGFAEGGATPRERNN